MPCPKCDSENIEEVESNFTDPNHHIETYECLDCGTIYTWESFRKTEYERNEEEAKKENNEYRRQLERENELFEKYIREKEEEEDMEDGG